MTELPPETSYASLKRAQSCDKKESTESMAQIVATYRPFILMVVKKHLWNNLDHVEDVTHDFIAKRMISGNVVSNFKFDKGVRFNAYLRQCVSNFCKTFIAKQAKKPNDFPVHNTDRDSVNNDDSILEEEAVWARTVFSTAIENLKAECLGQQKEHIWRAFHDQVLAPTFLGTAPRSPEDFGVNQQTLSNWLVTGYRKLRRLVSSQLVALQNNESPVELAERIVELLKRPIKNESIVKALLSKTFHDDQVSRIFLSGEAEGEIANLYPPEEVAASKLHRTWLKVLQLNPLELLGTEKVEVFGNSIDEVISGRDTRLSETRIAIQNKVKQKIESDASQEYRRIYFAIYTLSICSGIVHEHSRNTMLNTVQLKHNIEICREFEWLDEEFIEILDTAITKIDKE